jgi:GntR family transcriptional regulator
MTHSLSLQMLDRIDPRSPTPLYAQIASRVKLAIAAGDLAAGDGLPSVRQLAATLRINPATVVQAYRALEVDGFVEMRQGAGTFVHDLAPSRRLQERKAAARRLVRELLAEGGRLGISPHDIAAVLRDELNGAHQ